MTARAEDARRDEGRAPTGETPRPSAAAPAERTTRGARLLKSLQLIALPVIAIAGAVLGEEAFRDYVMEDAYITFRYARNLAEGSGFVFTPGERVLGTTTPLYTLILAGLHYLGADIEIAADWLFAASVGAVALLGGTLLRWLGSASAGLLFALLIVSGFGRLHLLWGLETAFYVGLLLGAVLALTRGRDVLAGVLAALAFLTRYDAALFAIVLFAFLTVARRRVPWRSGIIASCIVAPWLIFAQVYFGSVMPNTLGAKLGETGFTNYLLESGKRQLEYAWTPLFNHVGPRTLVPTWVLHALSIAIGLGVVIAVARPLRRFPMCGVLWVFTLVLWLGYALIGPPIAFNWYLLPGAIALLLLGLLGWSTLVSRPSVRHATGWAVLLVVSLTLFSLPRALGNDVDRNTENWVYRGRVEAYAEIAEWIDANGLNDLAVLTSEPGYLTYLTSNPAVDAAGLVTKGVYFHGDQERRTSMRDLIDRYEPGLMIASFPHVAQGYMLAYSALPTCRLLIRREVFDERFESLEAAFKAPQVVPKRAAPLHHPFAIDVDHFNRAEWERLGAILPVITATFQVRIDRKPVNEEILLVGKQCAGAATPPFLIDFDRLEFRFYATDPLASVAQLVIDGQVVLQQGGRVRKPPLDFELVSWSLRAWKGRTADLRFVTDNAAGGLVAADHIRSIVDRDWRVLDDFEQGWAFSEFWETSFTDSVFQRRMIARTHGLGYLGSARAGLSFGLLGERKLISRPFVLDHDRLSFTFYNFGGSGCRAELVVDGKVVRERIGTRSQGLESIVWDVRDLRLRDAVLRVIDDGEEPGAWTGIDDLGFSDD